MPQNVAPPPRSCCYSASLPIRSEKTHEITTDEIDTIFDEEGSNVEVLNKLKLVIDSQESQNHLVSFLLSKHAREPTTWIRFISAVNDLEATTEGKNEKSQKLEKIYNLFILRNSKFHLTGFHHKHLTSSPKRAKQETLFKLRDVVLLELLKQPMVTEFLKNTE